MANEGNKFRKDLITVILSNVIVLCGSIVTGFVVPKILGVTEYGYYKIFTLYLGYVSLLHFGFVDGILLEYAGKEYDELDKSRVRTRSQFFFKLEVIVSLVIFAVAICFLRGNYKTIISLLAIDTVVVNLTAYFQYLSQSTSQFKELSLRKILLATSKLLLAFVVYGVIKYRNSSDGSSTFYIAGLVLIDILLTGWYIYTYRDIVFGYKVPFKTEKNGIVQCFKNGIILTVSYQVSHLIFILDRQFVSILFPTDTYSVYSFAYQLISMVTTIINAVALVLFPALKKKNEHDVIASYENSIALISIVAFGSLIGYYPLQVIIRNLLPDYSGSITYLSIIFPGLALTCCINIIMFTYYKALNRHFTFFKISCIVLAFAAASNYLAYKFFDSPSAISVASIITLLVWYVLCELDFVKKYKIKWRKNAIYISLIMLTFYAIVIFVSNETIIMLSYSALYILITLVFHKRLLMSHLKRRR